MTARAIGGLLGGAAGSAVGHRHTNMQPVWRCSYNVDDERAQPWRPFGDGSVHQARAVIDAIVETAEAWADKVKEAGKLHPLSQNALKTLRRMLERFMDFPTGACDPSLDQISEAARFSRMTVIRHLKSLRDLKWLDWVRRTEPTGNSPKDGPTLKQATNAYFFEISRLPLEAQIHLRQILKDRGIKLAEAPDRKGSGPVPNRAQRLVGRVGAGMRDMIGGRRSRAQVAHLTDEAAFVREEFAFFGDIPVDQWAALRHPDDPPAQAAYSTRLGIPFFEGASTMSAPVSPPEEHKAQ